MKCKAAARTHEQRVQVRSPFERVAPRLRNDPLRDERLPISQVRSEPGAVCQRRWKTHFEEQLQIRLDKVTPLQALGGRRDGPNNRPRTVRHRST